jgi:hypothetical protein
MAKNQQKDEVLAELTEERTGGAAAVQCCQESLLLPSIAQAISRTMPGSVGRRHDKCQFSHHLVS